MKTAILFILTTLLCPAGHAQEVYTFAESIQVLLKNNAELRAAQESLDGAKSDLYSAYGTFLPSVSANLSYGRNQNDGADSEGYAGGITASENLFNGFKDIARVDDARAKVEVSEANLKNVKAKLSSDLKSSFASLSYAHEALKLADSIQKRRADNLNIVELRFQSGRENKGSVMLSAAYLKESALDLKRAQFYLENAKANFVRVLGLPVGMDVDIKGAGPDVVEPGTLPNFLELVTAVPDRVISSAQLKSAEASLKGSRSAFMPTLDLSGTVGSSGPNYFPDEEEHWSVGVSLSWSLFNGGKDYFANKKAFTEKLVAENTLRNLDLDLAFKLRQAFNAFVIAIDDFKVSEAIAEAQAVRAEIGRGKYNNGLSSFDDWDQIENELITRQKNLTEKRRDKAIAEAAWEKTQGRGVLP